LAQSPPRASVRHQGALSSNSLARASEATMAVRFCERTRGAPSLHRGWRTPDPSPTRTAKNLPAISLDLCVEEEVDEKWPCTTGGTYSEQKASEPFYGGKRCIDANQEDPPYGAYDGLSTPRGHEPSSPGSKDFPLPNGGICPDPPTYYEPRVRTPSPEHTYARRHEFYPPPPRPPTTCLPMNTLATVPMPMVLAYKGGVQGGCTGPDTFNGAGSMSQGIFQPYVKQEPCRSGYYARKQAPVQEELGWVVSRGSIGHPFSCGKACKYVKKRKGCKDGASCDHCHICDWHRCEAATRKYRADGHGAGI